MLETPGYNSPRAPKKDLKEEPKDPFFNKQPFDDEVLMVS